jgi:hypothetical protein
MNDDPTSMPTPTTTPTLKTTATTPTLKTTSLTVTNLDQEIKRVHSSTTVWRKLNTIRVESCVSLHKQVTEWQESTYLEFAHSGNGNLSRCGCNLQP